MKRSKQRKDQTGSQQSVFDSLGRRNRNELLDKLALKRLKANINVGDDVKPVTRDRLDKLDEEFWHDRRMSAVKFFLFFQVITTFSVLLTMLY